ncbi:MAG: Ldh family oxidoreductase [Dehalococcoidia bacterium]|nr:Ldh family oxidoreductase [Dehalococcoidia bacterium]
MTTDTRVQADKLRTFCYEALEKVGVPPADARIVADIQVESDLRGVHSHGTIAIVGYIGRIKAGGTNPRPNIKIVKESANHALIDADWALGQLVGTRAMEICTAKAKKAGMATAGVFHSNHYGAAATYSMMALKQDLIGFTVTNAAAIIPPTGSKTGIFGTNPISMAVPTARSYPYVLDIATSHVATQKIVQARREGQKIPLGWGMDKDGNPTDDPAVALTSGIQPPMAGHKGYGLAMMVEILAGVLTGAWFGRASEAKNWAPQMKTNIGHFFMALDPSIYMPIDTFKERMEQLIDEIHSAEKMEGVERIYVPGEIEYLKREDYLKNGIPFPPATLARLEDFGREIGVSVKLR